STVTARAKNNLPQIIIVALMTIINIILSYFTWRGTQGNKRAIPSTEATSSEVAKSSSKETSSSAKSSSAKSSSKKKESSKKELKITAAGVSGSQMNYTVTDLPDSGNKITVAASTQAVWLAVSFGNVQSWQGTLQAGADHTVEVPSGTQSIQIRTGNATYTTAKLNDQTIDMNQAGVTSIVRTANLTISGAAAASSDQSGAASSSSSDAGQD
ncbi:MAG: RodZ domain-containing protein, partial [Schleiferilactobacillus harbinensis]